MEVEHQKSWLSRNWGWALGGGCLVLIIIAAVGFGSLVYGVSKMFTSSEPYKYAMEQTITNDQIIGLLGEPIETDGMMQGNISLSKDGGEANFSLPIKGQKGEAKIVVDAFKENGDWTYEKLYVQIKDTQEKINLLDKALESD